MMKTFEPKKQDLQKTWYIIDAKDQVLGRLASRVASVLRGKHKPTFTPHIDTGDPVVVVNASRVKVTGRKMEQKVYRRFSGYPGGLKEVSLDTMLSKKPETVIKLAVGRMLPTGPLGRVMMKKLKVYSTDKHPHAAQHPVTLEVK